MKFLKKYIIIIILAIAVLINSTNCYAAPDRTLKDAFGEGSSLSNVAGDSGYNNKVTSIDPIIGTIIKTFLSLLGIIFLVLMLYGGYLWMTDRGGGKDVEKAKGVIQAAVIGLVIVLAAYTITFFVINKLGDTL